jgi:glutathione S-transferase
MITLYVDRFWISPYAFSSFVALEEKQVPFRVVELGLDRKEQHADAYRTDSLTGRVPAIDHDGFWLSESSAIAEYLDDVYPAPLHARLLPAEVRDRARARQLMAWIRSDLMPIRIQRATHTMFYTRATKPLDAPGKEAAARLLAVAEQVIPDGATQLFAQWSLADADLGFMLMRLVLHDEPMPAKVKAFAEAQWQRPTSKKWRDHARPAYVAY